MTFMAENCMHKHYTEMELLHKKGSDQKNP